MGRDILAKFMKICAAVQAMLRFCLSSANGSNFGIIYGEEFMKFAVGGLRWCNIHTKYQEDWCKC